MNTFGLWLDNAIQAANLTKKEVAQRAGVSDGLVYQVTTDGKKPTPEFCVKIACALGLPTVEVLRRAGFPVIQSPPELDDPFLTESWALLQQVPEDARPWVLMALRAWASQGRE